jgi:hypothetical protein
MLAENEIIREAKRIFRLLVPSGAGLERVTGGSLKVATWQVRSVTGVRSKQARGIDDELMTVFQARKWLTAEADGQAMLSAAGRAWYHDTVADMDVYAGQHRVCERRCVLNEDADAETVVFNQAESPLSWLRCRKDRQGRHILSPSQFAAGERLRGDFEAAQLQPSITANWNSAASARSRRQKVGYRQADLPNSALDARRSFYNALDAVGPELAEILVDTCCYLKGLEASEKRRGWPKRSAKVVLQIALTRLAHHYGLDAMGDPSSPDGLHDRRTSQGVSGKPIDGQYRS